MEYYANGLKLHLPNDIVQLDPEKQTELYNGAYKKCLESIVNNDPPSNFDNGTKFCPRIWDRITCWPDTLPGTIVKQKCVDYINKFNTSGYAVRTCTENGTWYVNPLYNRTWTNYTECTFTSNTTYNGIWQEHMGNIRLMYSVGYGLSLVSLVIAVITMLFFKKLHCPRNTVHINLFISFILRAAVSFLKESLFIQGVGLKKDITISDAGKIEFIQEGLHWECKLLMVLFNYSLGANYMWIFVEGLYLHMLIFVSVFSERSRVHWYIVLGWGAPLLFVIPWVVVRACLEDELCWNIHRTTGYLWIIEGPIALVILINFFFFLNIVRVLFTKLQASNTPETRNYRYSRFQGYVKLAKSTLVLIPLFGVHYIVFLGMQHEHVNDKLELAKLYFEMFFNSFQGFLVAILFCFLNGEVRAEFRKKWRRFQIRRGSFAGGSLHMNNSTWATTQTYVNTKPQRTTSHSSNSIALNEKVEYSAVPNGSSIVKNNNTSSQMSTSSGDSVERESESKNIPENETESNSLLLNHNNESTSNLPNNKTLPIVSVDLEYDLESRKSNNLLENDCIDARLNQLNNSSSIQEKQDNILREMDQLLEVNKDSDSLGTNNGKDSGYEEYTPMIC